MQIKKFREDCLSGGFNPEGLSDYEMLLTPACFQAVGKTRGWREKMSDSPSPVRYDYNQWIYKWHTFIDHLADGKDVNEALTAISE